MKKVSGLMRMIVFMLVFSMLFTSCKSDRSDDPDEPVNYIDITDYTLIRSDSTSGQIIEASIELKNKITAACGYKIDLKTDFLKFNETAPNDTYEILIGSTNRDASANSLKQLTDYRINHANDYTISVMGTKIVINGTNEEATLEAIAYFTDTVLPQLSQKKLPDSYAYFSRKDYNMIMLDDSPITDYTILLDENANDEIIDGVDVLLESVRYLAGYILPITTDPAFDGKLIKIGVEGDDLEMGQIFFEGSDLNITAGHFIPLGKLVADFASLLMSNAEYDADFLYNRGFDTIPLALEKYPDLKLVWYDDFEYKTGETWADKWSAQSVPATAESMNPDITESEDEKNIFVDDDGNLVLRVLNDGTESKPYSVPKHMTTQQTMNWTYGYLEVRAKVPTGKGLWPSLWTMQREDLREDEAWSAEIDIFESFAANDKFVPNVHIWHNNGQHNSTLASGIKSQYKTDTPSEEYHIYGFYWDSEKMVFSIDGVDYCTVDLVKSSFTNVEGVECPVGEDGLGVFHSPMYLLIGNPIFSPKCNFFGGGVPGAEVNPNMVIDETTTMPADYVVDYVRLYQGTDGVLITTPQK